MLNTVWKKALCFALVILLCLAPAMSVGAAAVNYPDGVTQADCEAAIPKLDKVIPAAVRLTGKTLDETVYGTVVSDATLNGLFKSVYTEMAGNVSTLNLMGVNVSPAALAEALSDYPAVSQKISGLASLEDVLSVCESFRWGVTTKYGFAAAAAAMFSPFNKLLNVILCGGTAYINLLVAIKGDDGYGNTVVPLLRVLDCPSVMSSADFAAEAASDPNSMVRNIVMMLFGAVDHLLEAPGAGVCSTLPALAWYIHTGKLSAAVKSLTDPLALRIGIVTIPGITALLGSIANLEGMDVSAMLGDIDISKLTGGENATLKLPEMDLAALAACGTEKDGAFTADRPAALITVTGWLVKTLKLNADAFTAENADAAKLLTPLLAKTDDELVKGLLLLLGESRGTFSNPFKWTYGEYQRDEMLSTPNLTLDDYATVLEKIDPFLDEVAAEKNPGSTIADTIRPLIYSNSLLGTITAALYGALDSEDAKAAMPVLGLDASPAGVADAISRSRGSAARTLRGLSSWEQLSANAIDFGFENGDRDGFKKALADVLSPFEPLFRYLFAEGRITILDGIELDGSDGYNTVVIPILEALGCPTASIKTYAEYKKTADENALTDVIEPVLALLDQICEKPVKTACSKLPNIVYFLYNDGLKNCLSNLLYPITAKMDQIGLSGVITGDLFDASSLDVDQAVEKLVGSSDLKIKLLRPNLRRLESFGNQETLVSKRTVEGAQTVYTYIQADSPSVLLTALRYLVNTLSLEENKAVLTSFMGSLMESQSKEADPDKPDMMAMYAGSIGEKFKNMSTDEIIEWLYDLLFRETPKVATETDYIPTIIYEKEKTHHPAAVIAVILVLLVVAFFVLRYLDKRKKFEKLKENLREKRREKLEKKNRKRVEAGKPPKQKKEKTPKPAKSEKKPKEKRKKLTPQEKQAAKNAAVEEKLRKKAMRSAKTPVQHTPPAPEQTAPQKAPPAQGARPAETPAAPQQTARPAQQTARPPQQPMRPAQQTARPPQQGARPYGTAQTRQTPYPAQQTRQSVRPAGYPPQARPYAGQPTAQQRPAPTYAPGAPVQDRYPAPGAPAGRPVPPAQRNRFEASVTMSAKRAEQLNKAQAKAAKEAQKNQAKTERIYAKAMKEAKKNQEGGRK